MIDSPKPSIRAQESLASTNENRDAMRASLYEDWLRRLVLVAMLLLVTVFAVKMLIYSFGPFRALFNSDDAASVLYGYEMIAQHSLLPQWDNATGVMFPLIMPRLLAEPLALLAMHDWFHADRLAVAIDQGLMFGLIYWVLGRAGLSTVARLFLIALLLIGPSWMFWSQTTLLAGKSWTYTFVLLLTWFAWRVTEAATILDARPALIALLIVGALIFVDIANVAMLLPGLAVALVANALTHREARRAAGVAAAIAGLFAAVVLGRLLFFGLFSHDVYSAVSMPFVPLAEISKNLSAFLLGLPIAFGALPPAGLSPYSFAAAAAGVKFVMLLIAVAMPLYLSLRYDRLANRYARLLAVACSVSLLIRVYIFLFTGISNGELGAARYFIPDLLLGVTITLFYIQQRFGTRWPRELVILAAILPFAIGPASSESWMKSAGSEALTRTLQETGTTRGYAGFWSANVVTVFSNGALRLSPVQVGNGTVGPYAWLTSNRWFRGDPSVKQSLLLLNPSERLLPMAEFERAVGTPEKVIILPNGYEARIYPFDLALRLAWSSQ